MSVDGNRQYKAQYCSVKLIKIYHELQKETLGERIKSFFLGRPNVLTYHLIFKIQVTSDTGKKHTVYIRTNPDYGALNVMGNTVQVFCDCSDFKYRSAYMLNKSNAVFLNDRLKLLLGAALIDKPRGKAGSSPLCKHAYAALQWLISNYSGLIKTL